MRIAVIGAGISGLTFAAAMKRRAPAAQVELYERDDSASSRPQGYAIGLRNEAGMQVLADLGLRDQVLARDAVSVGRFVAMRPAKSFWRSGLATRTTGTRPIACNGLISSRCCAKPWATRRSTTVVTALASSLARRARRQPSLQTVGASRRTT